MKRARRHSRVRTSGAHTAPRDGRNDKRIVSSGNGKPTSAKIAPESPDHQPEQWRTLAQRLHFRATEVARELGISRRQLQRSTRTALGLSPHDWLMRERLAAAAETLASSGSVKRAAFELGFKQVSHFSRRFKLEYGFSPAAFLAQTTQRLAGTRYSIPSNLPLPG